MTGSYSIAELNVLSSLKLISALAESGVRDFVISSGSRCAPLVLAVARHPGLNVLTHFDERSAGFLALGIAKAKRRPAALICTSGTAAANYWPAVVEARLSHTPLVVLTADRPPELRGTGAPQTIDQVGLYGRYSRYFSDLPVTRDDHSMAEWITQGRMAVGAAQGPLSGPVHLNVPFGEPLVPDPETFERIAVEYFTTEVAQTPSTRSNAAAVQATLHHDWDELVSRLMEAERGMIVCGPQNMHDDLGNSVTSLATRLGFPILADVASQVRFGPHHRRGIISHFDLCLRHRTFAESMRPDVVLRLGGLPTSKVLNEWLAAVPRHEHVIIEQQGEVADPDRLGTIKLAADLTQACAEMSRRLGDASARSREYAQQWERAEKDVAGVQDSELETQHPGFSGTVVRSVLRSAPEGTAIFLSNSLPIRWAEFYATAGAAQLRVLCNRGANGIDGIVSTAAGIAAALGRPVVLVIGDVTLLHDLNGLAAVRQYNLPLKIVLLNNDGGGIFSFLPISAHQSVSETLVAMPHGLDFRHAAEFWGIRYQCLDSAGTFEAAYRASFTTDGPDILEFKSSRDGDRAISREISRQIAGRLAGNS